MIYDIAIIGAGPGGYVSAIRAAQLGAKVALIEKEHVGGTCLNWGCIPSKAVLTSSDKYNMAKSFAKFGVTVDNLNFDYGIVSQRKWGIVEKIRKNLTSLINSYKIDIISGEASVESDTLLKVKSSDTEIDVEFKNLIIASGSRPVSLPGLCIDHNFILDTNDILEMDQLPESVLIVGSGASGIEWSRIFSNFDKKVTLVEIAKKLAPMSDKDVSDRIERIFKRKRIEFYTDTKIESISDNVVTLSNSKQTNPDIIFLAAGRAPNSEIEGLDKIGIEKCGKYIKVDNSLRTNISNIYAIGDVTGILPLAHVASHQGYNVVEHILKGKDFNINYYAVPKIMYGSPEICSVGYTEGELESKGIAYKSSIFPVSAIGKALVEDEIEGFVKVLADGNKILGVHIISEHGASMIQQAAIAINSGISVDEFVETVFAHPTYSEAVYEAFLGINDWPIHMPKQSAK